MDFMEFLKQVLGDDLFKQVETKLNEHNGAEENKENQIKLGNLGGGEYVGKGKYEALQELLKGKETELTSANDLISQLKKDTKGNEELQGKITTYLELFKRRFELGTGCRLHGALTVNRWRITLLKLPPKCS